MALFTPTSFTAGTPALASQVNANFDAIAAIINGAIAEANLANGAVTENKLADLAVTTTKLQNLAVTNAKVAAGISATKISGGLVSDIEFDYLNGVTSAIQAQLDGKQAAGSYHVVGDGTIAGTAVVTDVDETLKSIAVTEAEMNYLQGLTSNVQNQLNAKLESVGTADIGAKAVTAAKLADDAVGADPTWDTTDPSGSYAVAALGVQAVPAGVWAWYATGSVKLQVYVNGTWRSIATAATNGDLHTAGFVISDGTNARWSGNGASSATVYVRQIWP